MKRSFRKGNHLWAVESVGKRVTTTWGVVGGKTQSKSITHGNTSEAKLQLWTDARLKQRAGYAETTFRGDLPLDDPTAQSLIEALAEDPDDLASHMAFADWLSEQADDRLTAWGEFMRLQLAQERSPPTGKRKTPDMRRIEELRDDYEMHWLGERLAIPLLDMGTDDRRIGKGISRFLPEHYKRGWLNLLEVNLDRALAREMGKAGVLKLLRTLAISNNREEGTLAILAKSSVLANVRHLMIFAFTPDGGLNGLLCSMPRLESLCLGVLRLAPGTLFSMPSLASLDTLEVVGPVNYNVKKLAANPALANLRRLALNMAKGIYPIFENEPGHLRDAEIRAICNSPHLKGLKELALHSVGITRRGCNAFVDSGIFARLELLDLTRGNFDDVSIEILAACPHFARIPRVILDENYLGEETVLRLRRINEGVEATDQRNILEDDDDFDELMGDFDDEF